MNSKRYSILMSDKAELTSDEIAAGWHFCWEWDGLLVGPGMYELGNCWCLDRKHPVYLTIQKRNPLAKIKFLQFGH